MSAEIPLPLTASLKPERNIGVEKVLYTRRISEYPINKDVRITRIFAPWTVGLSPTSRCTRECFFCSHKERNKKGNFLTEEKMDEIVADLREKLTPKGVILAGGGEPTFWQGDLSGYIQSLSEFCSIGMDTNGTLLDRFLRNGSIWKLFYATVPILGHDRESYRRICGKDQFEVVDNNLRTILAAKKETGNKYPWINLKVAINQRTYRDFIPMLHYAESIGADNIFVRCMNNFEGRTDIDLTKEQRHFVYETVLNEPGFEKGYVKAFAENLIQEKDRVLVQGQGAPVRPSYCWTVILMHNAGIKQNGEVFLCVPTTDQEEYSIGNINETKLTELWGSPQHLQVIEKLDERMRSGLCDLGKCRHYRLNIVLEMARRGSLDVNLPEEQFLERHGPFL